MSHKVSIAAKGNFPCTADLTRLVVWVDRSFGILERSALLGTPESATKKSRHVMLYCEDSTFLRNLVVGGRRVQP
jgi:hypothetical protein